MVEWHHQLNGHEFEQTLGDGEGQESLVYCSPWGHKESDVTEQLNNNNEPGRRPSPDHAGIMVLDFQPLKVLKINSVVYKLSNV